MQSCGLNICLRFSWPSFFQLTPPLLPTQNFQESPSNCGEAFPPIVLHMHLELSKEKAAWSGKLTGHTLPHPCISYFLISSEDKYMLLMVTMIVCIWILQVGGRRLLIITFEDTFCTEIRICNALQGFQLYWMCQVLVKFFKPKAATMPSRESVAFAVVNLAEIADLSSQAAPFKAETATFLDSLTDDGVEP